MASGTGKLLSLASATAHVAVVLAQDDSDAPVIGQPPVNFPPDDQTDLKYLPILTDGQWLPRVSHGTVSFKNYLYLMGGTLLDEVGTQPTDFNSRVAGDLYTSADRGQNWERVEIIESRGRDGNFSNVEDAPAQVITRTAFSVVAWEEKDMLLVFAGINVEGQLLNDIWLTNDGVMWSSLTEGAVWEPRHSPAHIVFQDRLWLLGGCTVDGCPSDVWSWDGEMAKPWVNINSKAPWTGRRAHGVAALADRMLIFGGTCLPDVLCAQCNSNPEIGKSVALLDDVWASNDGVYWVELTPAAGWTPRSEFGYATLGKSVWLFGGATVGVANDGEEVYVPTNDVYCSRDGEDWFQVSESNNQSDYWSVRSGTSVVVEEGIPGQLPFMYLIGGAVPSDVWVMLATDECLSAQDASPLPGDGSNCYGCKITTVEMSLYLSLGIVGGVGGIAIGFYALMARRRKDAMRAGRGRSGSKSHRRDRSSRRTRRSTFRSDKFGENGYERRLMDEDYMGSSNRFSFMSNPYSKTLSSHSNSRSWKSSWTRTNKSGSSNQQRLSIDSSACGAVSHSTDILDNNDFIIDYASLDIDHMIGSGSQGQVYTGRYAATPVAIKHYPGYMALRKHNSAQAEIEAKMLSRLHHPNVIRLFGICINSDECYLVMELGVQSMAEFIKSGQAAEASDELKRKILLQIAAGMSFLHRKNMVHRDLKPENVILDHDLNAKICDFACSRFLEAGTQENMTADVGTHIYMAPELFGRADHNDDNSVPFIYSSKVDVYSFGMCVYALETGRHPFQKEQQDGQFGFLELLNRITGGLRPCLPGSESFDSESTSSEFENLMVTCWSEQPTERPSFQDIIGYLESLEAGSCNSFASISDFMNKLSTLRETESEDDDGNYLKAQNTGAPSAKARFSDGDGDADVTETATGPPPSSAAGSCVLVHDIV